MGVHGHKTEEQGSRARGAYQYGSSRYRVESSLAARRVRIGPESFGMLEVDRTPQVRSSSCVCIAGTSYPAGGRVSSRLDSQRALLVAPYIRRHSSPYLEPSTSFPPNLTCSAPPARPADLLVAYLDVMSSFHRRARFWCS